MAGAKVPRAPDSGRPPGFFRRLWRAVRQVFHETMGTIFLLLALSWIFSALRLWQHGVERRLWMVAGCFALLLIYFALTSFQFSRRVR